MPTQGQSAIWNYRAMYLYGDDKVGSWISTVSITVAG